MTGPGSGGMLLEAWHYLQDHGGNPNSLSLYGQEKNLNTWAIAKMNLFLHDIDDAMIERGDTLRDPKHLTDGDVKGLKSFDLVMANPPFSLKSWGHDEWSTGDKWGRDIYGCPPKSYGDLAFVQHMLASVKTGGKMAVVLPHGVLFRGGAEGKIRKGLIEDDLLEAVIGVGPNLFYGAGIPACILLINKAKPEARRDKVLIINGAEQYREGKAQNYLDDSHIKALSAAFHAYADTDKLARVVTRAEIAKNDHNLNLSRYVQIGEDEEVVNVKTEAAKLVALQSERDAAEATMMAHLQELGYVD